MTASKSERIFHRARQISDAGERASHLDEACGDDVALRARVEALLKADALAGAFMKSVSYDTGTEEGATVMDTLPREQPGERIPRYKLLQQIGEGGFGTVWLAEQKEPVRRRVAVKIIKLGMDTKQIIARFEAERQALAMMDHPNIARVLDAGSTDAGRPFFVMEYIRGVPVVEYCDKERLDTKARLDLFSTICKAIQHAHQKGIIHRDIKPSNVLVTLHDGKPVPMVIDFGIAKATNAELTSKTLFTEHHQMIGTPAYMSPEQAEMSGLDIDTRADIYSLGVLLYELLTGTTPFDARSLLAAGYAEMMRVIREDEPDKPSTRLSTLGGTGDRTAQLRGAKPGRLSLVLRGDLDWIVMKCLEKDRTRRYDTASGLAADIQRHLNDEPVVAGPPSAGYKLRKFIKRNRGKVVGGAVIAGVLLLGVAGTSTALVRAMRAERDALAQRDLATSAEHRTTKVAEFLQNMIGYADPHSGKRPNFTMRQALDEASRSIDHRLHDEPAIEADIRMSVGTAYRHLGEFDLATSHYREALKLRRESFGEQHAEVAATLAGLAGVASERALQRANSGQSPESEYRESVRLYREALEMRKAVFGERHVQVVNTLSEMSRPLRRLGGRHRADLDEAEAIARRAVELANELEGEEGQATLGASSHLAAVLQAQGRLDEAEAMYTRTLELRRRVLGPEDRETLQSMTALARFLTRLERYDEARSLDRETYDIQLRTLGEDHPDTMESLVNLSWSLQMQGRFAESREWLREVYEIRHRSLGENHRDTQRALSALAGSLLMEGRYDESEPLLREIYESSRAELGDEHPGTLSNEAVLADCIGLQGRYDESGRMLRQAYEVSRRESGRDHGNTLGILHRLARNRLDAGLFDEAEPLYYELLQSQSRISGEEAPGTLLTASNLGLVILSRGRLSEAEPLLNEILETQRRVLGQDHEITLFTQSNLGLVALRRGRYDEAEEGLVDAAERIDVPKRTGLLRLEMMQPTYERVIELYDAWDAAEPGKGHDEQAETWRERLSILRTPA